MGTRVFLPKEAVAALAIIYLIAAVVAACLVLLLGTKKVLGHVLLVGQGQYPHY
jgi:hypothetical protein